MKKENSESLRSTKLPLISRLCSIHKIVEQTILRLCQPVRLLPWIWNGEPERRVKGMREKYLERMKLIQGQYLLQNLQAIYLLLEVWTQKPLM